VADIRNQEINEMLGGKMSNEDEDEVEDELLAMEREANGVPAMPNAPTQVQEPMPEVPANDPQRAREKERAQRRQREAIAA
jgi:charged multivesicular body protein 6